MSVHGAHLDLDDVAAELQAPLFKLNVTGRKTNDIFLHVYFITYIIYIYINVCECVCVYISGKL